jgi:6-pyruvoyltetrahydropterin/6-carboxytetrahydropterin synthase
MTHRITLERNSLRFAAAHFTVLGGDCEPLHGHNYAVTIDIEGSLTPASWVIDFAEARRIATAICAEVDHRFILPVRSRDLQVTETLGAFEIRHRDKRYVIPRADVVPLPIDNSTAERLAEWFAGRMAEETSRLGATNITSVTVGVEEAPGQAGWYRMEPGRPAAEARR